MTAAEADALRDRAHRWLEQYGYDAPGAFALVVLLRCGLPTRRDETPNPAAPQPEGAGT